MWRNHTITATCITPRSATLTKTTSGEWKENSSFSPADIAVLAQLSAQAFQEIVQQKSQSRAR